MIDLENYKFSDFKLLRAAICTPVDIETANFEHNVPEIIKYITQAHDLQASIVLFPQLILTGASCRDLIEFNDILSKEREALESLVEHSRSFPNQVIILGATSGNHNDLRSCAYVINNGKIYGDSLSSPDPFPKQIFSLGPGYCKIVVTVGGHRPEVDQLPSTDMFSSDIDIICNLSGDEILAGSTEYLASYYKTVGDKFGCAILHAAPGAQEEGVHIGQSFSYSNLSTVIGESVTNDTSFVTIDIDLEALRNQRRILKEKREKSKESIPLITYPLEIPCTIDTKGRDFINQGDVWKSFYNTGRILGLEQSLTDSFYREIINLQIAGLTSRVSNHRPVIGISGGQDSTHALAITWATLRYLGVDRPQYVIEGIIMPGLATKPETTKDAISLLEAFEIKPKVIDITKICNAELEALGRDTKDLVQDVVFENVQARARTQVLMNHANKVGGIVLGTGDLTETALGWCTYNGDHMSMYNVNRDIPKSLMSKLFYELPRNLFTDEQLKVLEYHYLLRATPELRLEESGSKPVYSEDILGPYEIHDFVIYHLMRNRFDFDKIELLALTNSDLLSRFRRVTIQNTINKFKERFINNQFKRDCLPPGPKIFPGTLPDLPSVSYRP